MYRAVMYITTLLFNHSWLFYMIDMILIELRHRATKKKAFHIQGHLAALTRSHLIGDHPSGVTKEQTRETMDPSPKTKP